MKTRQKTKGGTYYINRRHILHFTSQTSAISATEYKKTQLSLTNPRDAKSLPKIAPIRRAYNVVADNTGLSSFV